MQTQRENDHHGENDNGRKPAQTQIDLALLFATDLHIGSKWLYIQKDSAGMAAFGDFSPKP